DLRQMLVGEPAGPLGGEGRGVVAAVTGTQRQGHVFGDALRRQFSQERDVGRIAAVGARPPPALLFLCRQLIIFAFASATRGRARPSRFVEDKPPV
ncbi:MAG: hypothetical protein AAF891_08760, partial [Pseudomonadota bacterium]